jgi:hypothetical protein
MIGLADISLYSILLAGGMVLLPNRSVDKSIYLIKILILTNLILNLFNEYYISSYYKSDNKNNMFLFHFSTLCECMLLILYFRTFFQQKSFKNTLLILLLGFPIFMLLNLQFWEPITHYPSIPRMVECILIMLLSIIFFMNIFQQSTITDLVQYPHFWLASGLLLYFAGTFFMNIVGQMVLDTKKLGFDVYDIHSFLNIFLNIIYTIVLWMSSKRLISEQ